MIPLSKYISNLIGWHSPRRIVVFESDDWGSIRMPDREVRDTLIKQGIRVDQNYFTNNDSLENQAELQDLAETLLNFKDCKGRHPVFTTLNIMGNPDFEKIISGGFKEYFWQHFGDTYKAYGSDAQKMSSCWKSVEEAGVMFPEYHGHEHVNVPRWFRGLNAGLPITLQACNMHLSGIKPHHAKEDREDYQAAFDIDIPEDIPVINNLLSAGLVEFKKYFGRSAEYFVPTNGPLSKQAYPVLKEHGILYLNSSKIEREPLGNGKNKMLFRYLGKRVPPGFTIITRNVFFEPSATDRSADWVNKAIADVDIAFRFGKPAIICTHRVNYIGSIDPENKKRGLTQLDQLLKELLKRWPDIEFMSSSELGRLINKK
jgi:hypothetical protein